MLLAVTLVSLFLAQDSACLVPVPASFVSAGTVTGSFSVCLSAPPSCGVSYGLELVPAGTAFKLTGRLGLVGVDYTQPPVFPVTLGVNAPRDLGYTVNGSRALAAMAQKEIARYSFSHAGVAGVSYSLRLRAADSIVLFGVRPGECGYLFDSGPQHVEVPLDGKLPAPAVGGIHK